MARQSPPHAPWSRAQGRNGIVAERAVALFSGRRLADDTVLDGRFDSTTTIHIVQSVAPAARPAPEPAAADAAGARRLRFRFGDSKDDAEVSLALRWLEEKERIISVRSPRELQPPGPSRAARRSAWSSGWM